MTRVQVDVKHSVLQSPLFTVLVNASLKKSSRTPSQPTCSDKAVARQRVGMCHQCLIMSGACRW